MLFTDASLSAFLRGIGVTEWRWQATSETLVVQLPEGRTAAVSRAALLDAHGLADVVALIQGEPALGAATQETR